MSRKLKLNDYPPLMEEIKNVLKTVSYGSVEIYVQNSQVTQMTVRKIVKTRYNINEEETKSAINVKTIQIRQKQAELAQNPAELGQNFAERGQNRVLTKENQSAIKD